MAHDVFISYSSDDKAVADALCARLEARGIRCWIAPRDVVPGIQYAESISNALQQTRFLVLVFSSHTNRSNHVPREVEKAASFGKTIIPFRIEDVAPSTTLGYFITSIHWLDALSPPLARHIDTLADTIERYLPAAGTEQRSKASPPLLTAIPECQENVATRQRWVPLAAGLVLVIGVAIAIARWPRPSGPPVSTHKKAVAAAGSVDAETTATSSATAEKENASPPPVRGGNAPRAVWEAAERAAPGVELTLRERTVEPGGVYYVLSGRTADGKQIDVQSNASATSTIVMVDSSKAELTPVVREVLDNALRDLQITRIRTGGLRMGQVTVYRIEGTRSDGSHLDMYIDPFGKATVGGKPFYPYSIPLESVPPNVLEAMNAAQPNASWQRAELKPEGEKKVFHLHGVDTSGRNVHVLYFEGQAYFYCEISAAEVPPAVRAAVKEFYPGFRASAFEAHGAATPEIAYYRLPGRIGDESIVSLVRPDGTKITTE